MTLGNVQGKQEEITASTNEMCGFIFLLTSLFMKITLIVNNRVEVKYISVLLLSLSALLLSIVVLK